MLKNCADFGRQSMAIATPKVAQNWPSGSEMVRFEPTVSPAGRKLSTSVLMFQNFIGVISWEVAGGGARF